MTVYSPHPEQLVIIRRNDGMDYPFAYTEQIIRLNDWMAEHEPDIYWSGDGDDTATAILRVIEKYKPKPEQSQDTQPEPRYCWRCEVLTRQTRAESGGDVWWCCGRCGETERATIYLTHPTQ